MLLHVVAYRNRCNCCTRITNMGCSICSSQRRLCSNHLTIVVITIRQQQQACTSNMCCCGTSFTHPKQIIMNIHHHITTITCLCGTGKMKNTQESLINLRFNCNLPFIVHSYNNHQHHAVIIVVRGATHSTLRD